MSKLVKAMKDNDLKLFGKLLDGHEMQTHGYNILHEAVARDKPEFAKMALEKYPDLIYGQDFPYGNTPLMYAIFFWKLQLLQIFDKYPDSYSVMNLDGELPLFVSTKSKNLNITRHVYSMNPGAIRTPNNMGRLPLHEATSYGVSSTIIKFLYEQYPEANVMPDNWGNLPLHLCGKYTLDDKFTKSINANSGIVRFMAEQNPEILTKQNNAGDTPLHVLSTLCGELTSLFFEDMCHIMNMNPDVLLVKNNIDMLPIHIASFYHDENLTIEMLSRRPETMYGKYKSAKSIFDLWDLASLKKKNVLISHILSSDYSVRDEFWDFVPKPIQYIERYLHSILPKYRSRIAEYHMTRKSLAHLQSTYISIGLYLKKKNIILEPEIINAIILNSLNPFRIRHE